jgi:peroxiredoxin
VRVRELIKRYHEFEKNHIHLIAFFADSREEIASYAGKQKPPFPIIPDPSLAFYKRYGVESSHLGMLRAMLQPLKMFKVMTSGFFSMKAINDRPLIPADFLIDEDQTIRRVYYGTDFGDHLPIEEILSWKSKGTG